MNRHQRHIFIVLTKRPERMVEFYRWKIKQHGIPWQPSDNVWMGVTAENQEQVENRVPLLNSVKASVKFVSIEPMLGPVDIRLWFYTGFDEPPYDDVINWVICGGESGHNARPMHPDWVRSVRDQCQASGVPFFFKQWGEWMPISRPLTSSEINVLPDKYTSSKFLQVTDPYCEYCKTGKHNSGNLLDGVQHLQYPNFKPETLNPKL